MDEIIVDISKEMEITKLINMNDELFEMANKDEWEKVVDIYRNIPEAQTAKFSSSGNTALHIAVSKGKEEIVKQLIHQTISSKAGRKEALEIKNDKGDTPLHVALSMGNGDMCQLIAGLYPPLVGVGNANHETPISLAVQDGKKKAFLKLLKGAIEGDTSGEEGEEGKEGKEEKNGKDVAEESIRNFLFHMTRKDKWDEVVKIYKWTPLAHKTKITNSGDTALHIAVSHDNKQRVEELIEEIISNGEEGKEALKVKNEQGNTPLHVAASMRSVRMCECIAQVDPSLVAVRNKNGETPLFVAALYGQQEAFLCLLAACDSKDICEGYSRRNDGDTILHVALAGDYFDLAFQIIHLYPDGPNLVNSVNQAGISPLHLLAANPSNFKSCSHLGVYSKIIYHCIVVKNLQVDRRYRPSENVFTRCIHTIPFFRNVDPKVNITGKNGAPRVEDLESSAGSQVTNRARRHQLFPLNYVAVFEFLKLPFKRVLFVLGLGSGQLSRIVDVKQKHTWSVQIMKELIKNASSYEYGNTGTTASSDSTFVPDPLSRVPLSSSTGEGSEGEDKNGEGKDEPRERAENETTILIAAKNGVTKIEESIQEYFPLAIRNRNPENKNIIRLTMQNWQQDESLSGKGKGMQKPDTPILIAAKNGITEIVEKILNDFPFAIHDISVEKKNIVQLAVENRQPHIYELLRKRKISGDNVFRVVDSEGNSVLHLAAKLGDSNPWLIPGAALQMQWEIKWYEFVKDSMPFHFFPRYNNQGKTSEELFTETHKVLVKEGGEWLKKTSESFSVVAALIATVAFATSSTVPGGVSQETGTPTFEKHPAFSISAISSIVALCFSVTAVVMFLAILTSRYQERDFGRDLPGKLLVGLTALFLSIASMLVSFCATDYFVLKDNLKYVVFPVYAAMCLPVTFFALVQLPLYLDLIHATFKNVPQRKDKAVPL